MYRSALTVLSFLLLTAIATVATVRPGSIRRTEAVARPATLLEVEIENFRFAQDTVRVEPGTSIRWVNRDQVGHTSTAENGEWESPLLGPGETYTARFDDEGVFPYHCNPHPFMRGVVVVGG